MELDISEQAEKERGLVPMSIFEGFEKKNMMRIVVEPQPEIVADWMAWKGSLRCLEYQRDKFSQLCPYGAPGDVLRVPGTSFKTPHKIVSIKLERLHEISEEDAIKEGLSRTWLEKWADSLSCKAEVENPYWMIHHAAGEEGTFCFKCGEKRRKELLRKVVPDSCDWANLQSLDGGFVTEEDGCQQCDVCGKLLDYTLTNYGVKSEWEHYSEHGFNPKSASDAFHIQCLLYGSDVFGNEARVAFRSLWDSLNKKYPWSSNPWVWVIVSKNAQCEGGSL